MAFSLCEIGRGLGSIRWAYHVRVGVSIGAKGRAILDRRVSIVAYPSARGCP